jgi:hypothetical protein
VQCSAMVDHAKEVLRRKERLTYGGIKREFARDDEALVDPGEELEVSHA